MVSTRAQERGEVKKTAGRPEKGKRVKAEADRGEPEKKKRRQELKHEEGECK